MEQIWEDLDSGEIHIRDRWQFELKSEFIPLLSNKENIYCQEFFLFIPNSLQINKQTYTKSQFYQDQTSLIRYKTPEFSLKDLVDPNYSPSPLYRILALREAELTPAIRDTMEDELKLFGNIYRSALRVRVRTLIHEIDLMKVHNSAEMFCLNATNLATEIQDIQSKFTQVKEKMTKLWNDPSINKNFEYVEEFICNSTNHYLTGLLDTLRLAQRADCSEVDKLICDILIQARLFSASHAQTNGDAGKHGKVSNEFILYRKGLLNKYVLDALMLNINRFSIDERYQNYISGLSAGIAMLIYFSLFIWLGSVFLINSAPFLIFTVLFYVAKDRIKDWLKSISYQQAFKLFSDYKTEIRSPDEKNHLGVIKESFSFIDENKLAKEIKTIRNKEFHTILEAIPRPETVLYYKRTVVISEPVKKELPRRHDLSVIFRFNIHHFLLKASDPHESYVTIDPQTLKLVSLRLPKVYHLNLIIKNTYPQTNNSFKIELQKLRLIIDKNGIKRIEQL